MMLPKSARLVRLPDQDWTHLQAEKDAADGCAESRRDAHGCVLRDALVLHVGFCIVDIHSVAPTDFARDMRVDFSGVMRWTPGALHEAPAVCAGHDAILMLQSMHRKTR